MSQAMPTLHIRKGPATALPLVIRAIPTTRGQLSAPPTSASRTAKPKKIIDDWHQDNEHHDNEYQDHCHNIFHLIPILEGMDDPRPREAPSDRIAQWSGNILFAGLAKRLTLPGEQVH